MSLGKKMLGRRHVLPSVVSSLTELMVEGTFPTGTYLVTVHHPVSSDDGDLQKALYGSFLPIPSKDVFPMPDPAEYDRTNMPGAVVVREENIALHIGRKRTRLKFTNKGDRPIQASYPDTALKPLSGSDYGQDWFPLSFNRGKPSVRV